MNEQEHDQDVSRIRAGEGAPGGSIHANPSTSAAPRPVTSSAVDYAKDEAMRADALRQAFEGVSLRDAQYEARREGFKACQEALRATFHVAIALLRAIYPDAQPPRFSLSEVEEALDALRMPSEWERTPLGSDRVDRTPSAATPTGNAKDSDLCTLRASLITLRDQWCTEAGYYTDPSVSQLIYRCVAELDALIRDTPQEPQ